MVTLPAFSGIADGKQSIQNRVSRGLTQSIQGKFWDIISIVTTTSQFLPNLPLNSNLTTGAMYEI
jgi:hypothetical protein